MKVTAAALLILSAVANGATEGVVGSMKVDVYEGPKECSDDEKVTQGKFLSMHYTGTIDESSAAGEKGKTFDSSRDRGVTFDFQVGTGQVIPGWDKGLMNLCKGAKAILTIPPEMAYGDQGAGGDIPGGATLKFDVEVVDISDTGPPAPNIFKEIDLDSDGKLTKEEVTAFFLKEHKAPIPEGLWEAEDKDADGVISWAEFGGAKGDSPGGSEL